MSAVAAQPAIAYRRARSDNDLVSISAPVLDLVLRLKGGIITPSNDLRETVASLLEEFEQRAATLRYSDKQVQYTKFALASFVDETVLINPEFPLREEWEKYPLQLEYFGEHLAGIKFFERLNEIVRTVEDDADVVEVYYLCMLLGFKGKYKKYLEDQLKLVIAETADHLRRAGRLYEGELSPHWRANDQPEPPRDPSLPLWVKITSGFGITLVILIYMILLFLVRKEVNEAIDRLLE